jgi:hypothetical protein
MTEAHSRPPGRGPQVPGDYLWALVIASLFGLATAIHHGRWDPLAFGVLAIAFGLVTWRFMVALRARGASIGRWRDAVAIAVVLGLVASMALVSILDRTVLPEAAMARWTVGRVARLGSWIAVLGYIPSLRGRLEPEWLKTARFAVFATLVAVAGLSAIGASPEPDIDVWTIQQRGAEVLEQGKNPYTSATVPDTDPETDFVVPYVYPPLAIFVGVLGRAVGGDVRYALLGALLAIGVALRSIARAGLAIPPAPSRLALLEDAPALLFWQWPPLFMILDRSWIDPLQVMLIALGVAAHARRRQTLAAVMLGLAASSKQSMIWLVPLAIVLLRLDLRRWIVMGVSAAAPMVPFVLWDFRRLKYCLFDFMSTLPPRSDGLCFTSWMKHAFDVAFPTQVGFALAIGAVVMGCIRAPRGAADSARWGAPTFALALLFAYFAFFFFNRWAFANYYFLLAGLASITAASTLSASRAPSQS